MSGPESKTSGMAQRLKAKSKQIAGVILNDPDLQAEGRLRQQEADAADEARRRQAEADQRQARAQVRAAQDELQLEELQLQVERVPADEQQRLQAAQARWQAAIEHQAADEERDVAVRAQHLRQAVDRAGAQAHAEQRQAETQAEALERVAAEAERRADLLDEASSEA